MADSSRIIDIDTSDVQSLVNMIKTTLSEKGAQKVLERTFRRTGTHVKTILAQDLPKKYHIKSSTVKKDVFSPKINTGKNVGCTIPIIGVRHAIGGKTFGAKGGAHGWNAVAYAGRRYKIRTQIIKGKTSELPLGIDGTHSQFPRAGYPYQYNAPFRNYDAPRLNGVAFARTTPERFPIQKISGIATPQMPTNRSLDDVQGDIKETLQKRLEHEYEYYIGKIKTKSK